MQRYGHSTIFLPQKHVLETNTIMKYNALLLSISLLSVACNQSDTNTTRQPFNVQPSVFQPEISKNTVKTEPLIQANFRPPQV